MRLVRPGTHRVTSGKVTVCTGRVLSDAVSKSADKIRQVVAPAAFAEDGVGPGHRAAVFRAAGGEDADRDAHQGHVAQRWIVQLELHDA